MKDQLLELMEALVYQRNNLVLVLLKWTQNFTYDCIIELIIGICLLVKKKLLSLKPTIKLLTFQFDFVSNAYLMYLVLEVSLNGNVHDFLVDHNSIGKPEI